MSATTVNAFPPLHALNSSRGWFIALIVLLHAGFFWGLTHGVTVGSVQITPPLIVIDPAPAKPQPPPKRVIEVEPTFNRIFVPRIDQPVLHHDDEPTAPEQVSSEPRPLAPVTAVERPGAGPYIVEPQLDPRFPLTEPEYPVSEIRQGHEGIVMLAVQILPNGRVGAVRIDKSSGYAKLDESAAREARRWRMKPGSSDGTEMAMWKHVPIKFQLKN